MIIRHEVSARSFFGSLIAEAQEKGEIDKAFALLIRASSLFTTREQDIILNTLV